MTLKQMIRSMAIGTAALVMTAGPGWSDCSFKNDVPVSIIAPGFEAWKAMTNAMSECTNLAINLDQEFRIKQITALDADPALYEIAGVNAATFASLIERDLIRPLDDLIDETGVSVRDNQRIVVDGQTFGIATMLNTQHLMYRKDIFEQLGLDVPTTYDEFLEVAAEIDESGLVDYAVGATFLPGFNLGAEFVNLYLGFGGTLFGANNMVDLDREAGRKTLGLMRAMTSHMDPEYFVSDSTYVQQQFQRGKIAMSVLWASRAGAMEDEQESQVVGLIGSAAAPRVDNDAPPASTIWWGGIAIAKNTTEEKARAAFRVAMEGADTEMVRANNDLNIWLIEGFEPSPMALGAIANIQHGAPNYPASATMSILHNVIGNEVADYLTGEDDADAVLDKIAAEYRLRALEAGLIQE